MKSVFGFILCCLVSSVAFASSTRTTHSFKKLGTLLNGVALNAAAATRTLTATEQHLMGHGVLALYVSHSNSAATDVSMTCTGSDDGGTTYFSIQSCDVSSGDCTSTDASWTNAVTGDEDFVWRVDTLGIPRVQCLFAGTSAGGSDTVTVTAYAIAK